MISRQHYYVITTTTTTTTTSGLCNNSGITNWQPAAIVAGNVLSLITDALADPPENVLNYCFPPLSLSLEINTVVNVPMITFVVLFCFEVLSKHLKNVFSTIKSPWNKCTHIRTQTHPRQKKSSLQVKCQSFMSSYSSDMALYLVLWP